jgi:hypothetical protein
MSEIIAEEVVNRTQQLLAASRTELFKHKAAFDTATGDERNKHMLNIQVDEALITSCMFLLTGVILEG